MKNTEKQQEEGRRDVSSRKTKWANSIARWLISCNIAPNQISILSIVFSAVGGGILFYSAWSNLFDLFPALIIYIICIQLRLLCNLFDGMVAIEGNKKSPNGDLYNDIPDRFSDAFLIIPVGYVAGGIGVELGWLAVFLAVMTAYFRWIGAYKTGKHFFAGPMAKQHRMALLTCAALFSLFQLKTGYYHIVFLIMLIMMNTGLVLTLARRLYSMSHVKPDNTEL